MRPKGLLVACLLTATAVAPGCGSGRFANKPFGKGTYIPAAVCALIGAGGGVGIQELRRGESIATVSDPAMRASKRDDPEYWKGALVGGAIGAAVCGLAGHYFLDPEVVTPPPPPPPTPTPEPTLPPPSVKRIVLRGVNFDFDKNDIRPDSRPVLDAAAEVLNENPNVHISVEGHTDSVGTEAYNERLSVQRAEAVFRYLVNRGIAPERMAVIGYGESRPVAENETEEGRAQNRRTELNVVDQPQAQEP